MVVLSWFFSILLLFTLGVGGGGGGGGGIVFGVDCFVKAVVGVKGKANGDKATYQVGRKIYTLHNINRSIEEIHQR